VSDAPQLAWTWVPLVPPWAAIGLALLALAAVAAAAVSLASQPPWRRALAVGLRATALLPLGLAVAGLSRTAIESHTVRRPLVLLLDRSASMGVREDGVSRMQRVALELGEQRQALQAAGEAVQVYGLDGARLGATGAEAEPLELETDYLGGLELVREQVRPAAVVLFGDGADRSTLGAAWDSGGAEAVGSTLAGVPVPVHVRPVGGDLDQDLSITIGEHAPFAFVRRPIELTARVAGAADGPLTVELQQEGSTSATREVLVRDGTGEVTFRVTPEQVGTLTLGVRTAVPGDDPLPSNNADERTWRVIRDRTRVLHLTSHPSWDVRFLRRLFETDPNIDLVSFYVMRTGPLMGQFRSSPISLIEFPHEELFTEDLPGFDLLVLHNFTLGSLPSAMFAADRYMAAVQEFVERGGGLLVIGGDRAFVPMESRGMERLLPLPPIEGSPDGAGPARFTPTDVGLRHPAMRVGEGAVGQTAWEALPEVATYNRLGAPVDDAVVLATAGEGGDALLATRSVGTGRVLQLATDASWTWAMADQDLHAVLWRDVIRWLVRDEDEPLLQVGTERATCDLGQRIGLRLSLFDEDYAPHPSTDVRLTVGPLGGEAAVLQGVTDDGGAWAASVVPDRAGTWEVVAETADGFRRASARFSVRADPAELREPAALPELLAAIAATTGGEVLAPDHDLVALAREAHVEREVSREVDTPAWNLWGWLLLAALPLGLEWWLRRRWTRT